MELIFATHNKGKIKEIKEILPKNLQIHSLFDIDFINEIPETGTTLEENARIKAKTIFNTTNKNCFADDSGLIIPSLNGEPGVYSARYAGEEKNNQKNIQKVLNKLHDSNNREAEFQTVISLFWDGKPYEFKGVCKGTIIRSQKGENGFGYDPIFLPDGYSNTFAEMTSETKNKISHRSKAFQQLIVFLNRETSIN